MRWFGGICGAWMAPRLITSPPLAFEPSSVCAYKNPHALLGFSSSPMSAFVFLSIPVLTETVRQLEVSISEFEALAAARTEEDAGTIYDSYDHIAELVVRRSSSVCSPLSSWLTVFLAGHSNRLRG